MGRLPSDQAIHAFPTAMFRADRSLHLGRAFASVAAHALGDHGLYVYSFPYPHEVGITRQKSWSRAASRRPKVRVPRVDERVHGALRFHSVPLHPELSHV